MRIKPTEAFRKKFKAFVYSINPNFCVSQYGGNHISWAEIKMTLDLDKYGYMWLTHPTEYLKIAMKNYQELTGESPYGLFQTCTRRRGGEITTKKSASHKSKKMNKGKKKNVK